VVVPAVFTNHETDAGLIDLQHLGGIGPRLKMAVLVKHVVSWQQLLGVAQHDVALVQHQQHIVQALARALTSHGAADDPVLMRKRLRGAQQISHTRLNAL
jgi:hypothetical protein